MAVQRPWGVGLNLDLSLNPTQYSVVNSQPRHLKDRLLDFFVVKTKQLFNTNLLDLPTSRHNLVITFNDVHVGN